MGSFFFFYATPLHLACSYGDEETISLIVQNKQTDVNATNWNGSTPLHFAVNSGRVENVKRLLKVKGIRTDIKDQKGVSFFIYRTPFMLAEKRGNKEIIDALVGNSHVLFLS